MAHTAKTQAPGRLDLVRDFVNTKDVEDGTDELTSPGELADWLVVAGLAHGRREIDGLPEDLASVEVEPADAASGEVEPGGGAAAELSSNALAPGALAPDDLVVRPGDLRRAVELREALRAALLANNEGAAPEPATVAVLNRIAERAKLVTRFDEHGEAALEPASEGVDGALGRLLAIVYDAMGTDEWRRLKVCRNDTCLWAFYDTSKNRSKHWCSMDDCGSQVKARAYRLRQKAAPAADPD